MLILLITKTIIFLINFKINLICYILLFIIFISYILVIMYNNIRKYPEWDKARVCPATEVIRIRQELAEINEILKEKREEQKIRRKYMDEQWEEAREQQLQLRQSLIKFNTLVRQNIEKCERAEQKIKEEHERQEKYKQEVRS